MTNLEGESTHLNKESNRAMQAIRRLLGRQASYQSDRVTGNAVPDMFTPQGIKDIESVPESNGRVFTIHASYDTPEFPQESN